MSVHGKWGSKGVCNWGSEDSRIHQTLGLHLPPEKLVLLAFKEVLLYLLRRYFGVFFGGIAIIPS